MTANMNLEPNYGRRLMTQVLDEVADRDPQLVYAMITVSDHLPYSFRRVTFAEVARCVNYLAYWLEARIGRSEKFEALAFIGIMDLQGAIFFHAAVKLGYKVLLLSPRNPPETNLSLMEQVHCSTLCHVGELTSVLSELKAAAGDKIQQITTPSLSVMIKSESVHYKFKETIETSENNPVVIFHSSGSTGPPKPIQMTHGTFATIDNDRRLPNVNGRKKQDFSIWDFACPSYFYFAFPPFHLAGFMCSVIIPVFSTTAIPIFGPALKPSSGFIANDILNSLDVKAIFVPPSIVEQLLDEQHGEAHFQKMDFVLYAGGPLSQSAGNKLKDLVILGQYYGSTETSNIPQLLPDKENWAYMEWHPASNIEMQPSSLEVGTYEMVQFLSPDTRAHSLLNHNFPGLHQWRTKDLFKPHPTNKKLWQFSGRVDDIIVLSNGHKINPVTAEALIQEHPSLSGALIVGQGKFQAALLVEVKDHPTDALIEKIWPTVEQANTRLPGQGRISKSMILVARKEKAFHRTAKGTVVRKLTERDFATEIEGLYAGDDNSVELELPAWQTYEEDALRKFTRTTVSHCLPNTQLSDEDDLFLHGIDSLKVLEIIQALKSGLRSRLGGSKLPTRLLYENPSVEKLARAISRLLSKTQAPPSEKSFARVAAMTTMVENYSHDLENVRSESEAPDKNRLQIALTGSTGSVGFHLLRTFMKDPKVQTVWCLNRSGYSSEDFERRLSPSDRKHSKKVTHIKIDISKRHFGLEESKMAELIKNVDIIVHNAWKVDFNQILSSFEDHIRGVRNLIDWSTESPKHPRIFFTSSISSVARWPQSSSNQAAVPEIPILDYQVAANMGYAESKLVAEVLLHAASIRAGIPITILRIGQIAGSTYSADATWPAHEWLPLLVKTSKMMGMVPEGLADVDWIPIDKLVDIITEIIDTDLVSKRAEVYNLVNPRRVPWDSIIGTLRQYCGVGTQVVPFALWLETLEKADLESLSGEELASKPALKILPALRELMDVESPATYSTERGIKASATLRELGPVNQEWLSNWLQSMTGST